MVKKIKELAKKKNISIARLEKENSFSNGSISKWDKQPPAYDKVEKLADYFNVSIDWLLEREFSQTPEEIEIVNWYRKADERGKNRIYNAAKEEAQLQEKN